MSKKLHNPKSFAPAVYIPCWLIQVSIKLVSHGAKMVYGRLSQWANANGTVFRSVFQLAQELGCSERSIEEYIKELKNSGLIGTYHPQAGGVNHFEFYDHPWMHETINEHLVYKQDKYTPPHPSVVPPTPECGTPPHPSVDINNKEIKEIKCVGAEPNTHKNSPLNLKKKQSEEKALNSENVKNLFDEKFRGYDISLEQLFSECQEHYEQKSLWATQDKFLKWIKSAKIENYKKSVSKKSYANETESQRKERQHFENELFKESTRPGYISKDLQKYPEMRTKYQRG